MQYQRRSAKPEDLDKRESQNTQNIQDTTENHTSDKDFKEIIIKMLQLALRTGLKQIKKMEHLSKEDKKTQWIDH